MRNCAVVGCNSRSGNKSSGSDVLKFYSFPKNTDLAILWSDACGNDKINVKSAIMCSKHFESDCFFTPLKYKLTKEPMPKWFRNLCDDAIPTKFLPLNTTTHASTNTCSRACNEKSKIVKEEYDLKNGKTLLENILPNQNYNGTYAINQPKFEIQAMEEPIVQDSLGDNINELVSELENMKLKRHSVEKEIEQLQIEHEDLIIHNMKVNYKLSQYPVALSKHFTPGQIKRILNPNKKFSFWNSEDIASAISLKSVSPETYRYLRKNGYPLPGLSTLKRWAAETNKEPCLVYAEEVI